ncbi:DMT family transporter [Alicyclobacillus herbarius]|uniref:DMT family transporter n=1 Tax=Alicyclobacillus herbarius TaxID=122960 RepID=UPI002353A52A|nr:EamA family transporter [Alicyclobacillus herbarius]
MTTPSQAADPVPTRRNESAILAVAVTLIFWSSAFAGIRQALFLGFTPGHVVLLRFLSASAVFVIYALIRGVRLPKGRDRVAVAVLGWTGISVYHIALTFGEQTVDAGTASLLIAAAPAFTALIATFVLNERLRPLGWMGVVIGFIGIVLITMGSGPSHRVTMGAFYILLSAAATSVFFVGQKPLFARYSAIDLTAWFTWFGTLPMLWFLPGLTHDITHSPAAATWSCVYIGVFPAAIAYVAWAMALKAAPAGLVASSLYLNPILAIIIAWIWLGELPGWLSILGGAIAVCGVLLVNFGGTVKRKEATPSPSAADEAVENPPVQG